MKENVIKYYVLCNRLKNIIRKGWLDWNINRDRIESVAEHVYGTLMLAIAIYYEYDYNIDLNKVIMMLSIHELEETIISDLTEWDVDSNKKRENGHLATHNILNNIISANELEELISEFDNKSSKEAIFAYHVDKLECDIQCKLYYEENNKCVDMNNQSNNKSFYDERVQKLLKECKDFATMWLEFDKDKFKDDNNFVEILEYIENNSIK